MYLTRRTVSRSLVMQQTWEKVGLYLYYKKSCFCSKTWFLSNTHVFSFSPCTCSPWFQVFQMWESQVQLVSYLQTHLQFQVDSVLRRILVEMGRFFLKPNQAKMCGKHRNLSNAFMLWGIGQCHCHWNIPWSNPVSMLMVTDNTTMVAYHQHQNGTRCFSLYIDFIRVCQSDMLQEVRIWW